MNPGDRLSHYEIVGPIGRGGMGEVFRARDTRLDREVALKLLPPDFAADPERLARFRREAKLLAALNHPNIAAIHGLEEDAGRLCLAMELAEGETLAERIARGPMPVDEALEVAVQLAAGLEEAHEKGIVHRDLKPANVKLGPDGRVKILDFGLARAYLGDEAADNDAENSPTLTAAMTAAGVILGTAAYMSPEQARGHGIDSRTDVWAFGVIVWELLAGRRLFAGETVSDTLAMILRGEPDWDALPPEVPTSLRRLVQRCLQKDRRQRLHHVADARIVLQEIRQDGTSAHEPASGSFAAPRAGGRRGRAGWIVAAVVAAAAAVLGWRALDRPAPAPAPTVRFDLAVPDGTWIGYRRQCLDITPAGDALVIALVHAGGSQLYVRELDGTEFVPVPGTARAMTPFFSPDGRWIAFTQDDRLRRVDRDGGTPVDLCATEWGGGAWTGDGRIVFTRSYAGGLEVIPADGGQALPLTEPDPARRELGHWWPQVLPGDRWVIYTSWTTPIDSARIMALSLESGEQRELVRGGSFGRWTASGHLLWVRRGKLMAAPFDLDRMATTGRPAAVLDDVYANPTDAFANLAISRGGTLVRVTASVMAAPKELVWVDRSGAMTPLDAPARDYESARLSPDGGRIAVTVTDKGDPDVWLHDLGRGTWARFTFSPATDFNPQWTPDGRAVVYNREAPQFTLWRRPADGSAEPEPLLQEAFDTMPTDITPDGRAAVVTYADPETDSDIWLVPLDGAGAPRPLLKTRFSETMGTVSPDGRWLAYAGNESGLDQIYVMPFPDGGARVQVSLDGADEPGWSPRGDELYFRGREGLMVVALAPDAATAHELVTGRPRLLFSGDFQGDWISRSYAPDADARRFLMLHLPADSRPRTVRVVANWFGELAGGD